MKTILLAHCLVSLAKAASSLANKIIFIDGELNFN